MTPWLSGANGLQIVACHSFLLLFSTFISLSCFHFARTGLLWSIHGKLPDRVRRHETAHEVPNAAIAMQRICTPEPVSAANSMACAGGLNTSPCTSFQPVSSKASSCNVDMPALQAHIHYHDNHVTYTPPQTCISHTRSSSRLYLAMSRRSVRTMIIVKTPASKCNRVQVEYEPSVGIGNMKP